MEKLNIEIIAKICIDSQNYTYLQPYLFIKVTSVKYYKIKMSKYNYSLILELIGSTYHSGDYRTKKLYTTEDIEFMKVNLNLSIYEIAKILNRPVEGVGKKLKKIREELILENNSSNLKD